MPREQRCPVYFLGPANSYGHLVAKSLFLGMGNTSERWEEIEARPQPEICEKVNLRWNAFGVLAVENTSSGIVSEDVLAIERSSRRRLRIVAEYDVEVRFSIYSNVDSKPKRGPQGKIKVYCHPVAYDQCRKSLERLRKDFEIATDDFEIVNTKSNSAAAQNAAREGGLAISNEESAAAYGLLQLDLPTQPQLNTTGSPWANCVNDYIPSRTRFWVIANGECHPTKQELQEARFKSAILILLDKAKSGVLFRSLEPFQRRGISVHLVYPCIIPGRGWEYVFLFEVEGHIDHPPLSEAYEELMGMRSLMAAPPSFLGSYVNVSSVAELTGEASKRDTAIKTTQDLLLRLADSFSKGLSDATA